MKFIHFCLICYLTILSPSLRAAIFAEDERQRVNSTHVGAVLCTMPGTKTLSTIGTASLVSSTNKTSPNSIILTNEHVIRDMQTGNDLDCWFAINANLKTKYRLSSNRVYGGKFESDQIADDWALAALKDKIPEQLASTLPLYAPKQQELDSTLFEYNIIAYNSGAESNNQFTGEMTITDNCRIFPADESPLFKLHEHDKLLFTDCDCYEGCSGAPLIYKGQQNKLLIGVYFGSYFSGRYYLGGSQRFTAFDIFRYVNGAIRITKRHIDAFEQLKSRLTSK